MISVTVVVGQQRLEHAEADRLVDHAADQARALGGGEDRPLAGDHAADDALQPRAALLLGMSSRSRRGRPPPAAGGGSSATVAACASGRACPSGMLSAASGRNRSRSAISAPPLTARGGAGYRRRADRRPRFHQCSVSGIVADRVTACSGSQPTTTGTGTLTDQVSPEPDTVTGRRLGETADAAAE